MFNYWSPQSRRGLINRLFFSTGNRFHIPQLHPSSDPKYASIVDASIRITNWHFSTCDYFADLLVSVSIPHCVMGVSPLAQKSGPLTSFLQFLYYWRADYVLLFCCRAIVEVFSAAANRKPLANKDFLNQEICETSFIKGDS